MHLVAIFTGRFFNRPKSIQGGYGVTFQDDGGGNYTASLSRSGRLSKSIAGTGTTALSTTEAAKKVLEFTGVLTGNMVVTLPAFQDGEAWDVFNNTTGAHTVTLKGPSGTGVTITQTKRVRIYSTDVDLFACTPEA